MTSETTNAPEQTNDLGTEVEATTSKSEFMEVAVAAALDRKAEEITILDLAKVSDFTELFLVCNGTNDRQVKAIADNVRDQLRAHGLRPLHVEGENSGRWVLMDYGGEMVIHVFEQETRRFYALERLWADAPVVTSQYVPEDAGQEE